jgi:hypothetical protein
MKKRLLFALMAMCVAVSGFALSQGEFVYTPQGRFQITGANLNANNAFQNMDGWTVIGEGKKLTDLFNTNANGLAEGMNSVVSISATDSVGMYYKFEPTDASATYVVSFKLKGALLDCVKTFIPGDGYKTQANLVKVAGNATHTYTYPATEDEVIVNTSEELNEDWQTFYYAIQGDGTARTWFISFTAMATTIEIADLQIAPALQFADLRQRDAMLEKLNIYRNCYNWPADVLAEFGYDEAIANLQAIGDEAGQVELDEQLATAQEILSEFLNTKMDDYLAGGTTVSGANDNYLGIKTTDGNIQKVSNYGDWTCTTTGRAFWSNGDYPDLGHYGGNNSWNYNNPNDPMGVYMQKTLDPGSYVFAIESKAALRADATSSSWTLNEGWDPAYGVAYVVKIVDGVVADTIVSQVKDLESLNYTQFMVAAKIEEAGTYEIGFKAWCKDAYKDLKNGSVTYVKDASIYGKNDNKYNQKQLGYEADVREQITTGRTEITKAKEYIANAEYFWGKAELQACVDTVETKIAAYEQLDQDAIIATYDFDAYVKENRLKTAEEGLLVFEVYNEAVRDILAANKKFVAVNDTLKSIQTAIDNAQAVLVMRLYSSADGKADLQAAIDKAKGIQAAMKAVDYSEENAAIIVAANAELDEAVEIFKTTIPESAIATIVDIDFENDAYEDSDTHLFSIDGEEGTMEFSSWSVDGTGNQPFEKGYWANGEQLWKGYIRVGNGTGTTIFDPLPDGSNDMGTNILKVACDFYVQGLSGRSIGFYLKNEVDGEDGTVDADVFGLFHNFYNGETTTNTCNVDIAMIWAKSGGSYNNASPADATDSVTANPLQKSHIEVIMDYGKKTMYCTISSVNGTTASEEVALDAVPTKFVLQCNYNNNDRRCWFDNLKIQRITTGAYDPTGIADVKTAKVAAGAVYNLAGQKVGKDYKGIVVKDGVKLIQK